VAIRIAPAVAAAEPISLAGINTALFSNGSGTLANLNRNHWNIHDNTSVFITGGTGRGRHERAGRLAGK
jgi:hypothetical protein